MKKINLLLIAILLVVTVSAQNKKAEKKLVGTWTLQEVEVENIDELAQSVLDMQVEILEVQITMLENFVNETEDEVEKQTYTEQLEELKSQKDEFTLEVIKESFTTEFNNLIGSLKLIFNKDKSYKSILDDKEGTWELYKKGKELIITEGDRDVVFEVLELSKTVLFLKIIENQGEIKIIMKMRFTKN